MHTGVNVMNKIRRCSTFLLISASLATLLLSCVSIRPSEFITAPRSLSSLRAAIDSLLSDSLFIPTRAGIKVVSLQTGEVLYERDSHVLFHPASNLKLLTAATALRILGRNYQVHTSVFGELTPDSTIKGDLFIKGYGDPDLTVKDLESIADSLKAAGVKRVFGNVVSDVSYFDSLYWGTGWMWDDDPACWQMYLTPLSIEKNCIEVIVSPGNRVGSPPTVNLNPPTSFIAVQNEATTISASDSETLSVDRLWRERLNVITVKGGIRATSQPQHYHVNVWQPELYAASLFRDVLHSKGIEVLGGIKSLRRNSTVDELKHKSTFTMLADHARVLDSILVNMNKVSDNLSAENVLRIIGAVTYTAPGSAEKGLWTLHSVLQQMGIDSTSYYTVDGSGVSHYNLVNADILVKLLTAMYRDSKNFDLFYASLPIGGVDGTLKNRMKGSPAEENVHAKTGSINGVSSLSGYVHTRDGEPIAFSMLMQNFIGSGQSYRYVQDRICALLAEFSRQQR